MKQESLDFSVTEKALSPEEALRKELNTLPFNELSARYLAAVGVNPRVGTDLNIVIDGIVNPEQERARLYAVDTEEDRESLRKQHSR